MKRRIYLLLRNAAHAGNVVQSLVEQGIDRGHIHVVAGQTFDSADPAQAGGQPRDMAARIRNVLWLANLAVFCMALLLMIVMLLLRSDWSWLLPPMGIMLISFIAGFGLNPRSSADRPITFRDTRRQGEVLLKVDVPVQQAARVEELVQQRYPGVAIGGTGWGHDHLPV